MITKKIHILAILTNFLFFSACSSIHADKQPDKYNAQIHNSSIRFHIIDDHDGRKQYPPGYTIEAIYEGKPHFVKMEQEYIIPLLSKVRKMVSIRFNYKSGFYDYWFAIQPGEHISFGSCPCGGIHVHNSSYYYDGNAICAAKKTICKEGDYGYKEQCLCPKETHVLTPGIGNDSVCGETTRCIKTPLLRFVKKSTVDLVFEYPYEGNPFDPTSFVPAYSGVSHSHQISLGIKPEKINAEFKLIYSAALTLEPGKKYIVTLNGKGIESIKETP